MAKKSFVEKSVRIGNIDEQKKRIVKDNVTFGAIISVIGAYVICNVTAYSFDNGTDMVDSFSGGLSKMFTNPLYGFQGGIAPGTGAWIFLFVAIIVLAMTVNYAKATNNLTNMLDGEVGGSSGFESVKVCQEMYMDF